MTRQQQGQRAERLTLACAALLSAACATETSSEQLDKAGQDIINGTVPAKGALESWGVVALSSGCSGMLLTNRHVLTAHHCVRDIFTSPFTSYLPISVVLEKAAAAGGDQTVVASTAVEHDQPYSLENLDYAILVLDEPMNVAGQPDTFYRGYFTGTESTLKNKSVFCAGYGMTTLAKKVAGTWVPGGDFKLSSANQTIDDV